MAITEAHSLLDAGELSWRYDAFADVGRGPGAGGGLMGGRRRRRGLPLMRSHPGRQLPANASAAPPPFRTPLPKVWQIMSEEYCLKTRFKALQLKVRRRRPLALHGAPPRGPFLGRLPALRLTNHRRPPSHLPPRPSHIQPPPPPPPPPHPTPPHPTPPHPTTKNQLDEFKSTATFDLKHRHGRRYAKLTDRVILLLVISCAIALLELLLPAAAPDGPAGRGSGEGEKGGGGGGGGGGGAGDDDKEWAWDGGTQEQRRWWQRRGGGGGGDDAAVRVRAGAVAAEGGDGEGLAAEGEAKPGPAGDAAAGTRRQGWSGWWPGRNGGGGAE
jgi:hypothetical protein